MMGAIIDSNVLIDILQSDARWAPWSGKRVDELRQQGPVVINPIIYAEVAAAFSDQASVDRALPTGIFEREDLPWEAAFPAGRAFVQYRRSGGTKRSPLPDFYIGAHAQTRNYRLLTRDPGRYRSYFPDLDIVAPDTHP